MKKMIIGVIALLSLSVFAQPTIFSGWSFFAPDVADEQALNDILEPGDIVYDRGDKKFYGKKDSGNNWLEFGAEAPTDGVKTPGATKPTLVSAKVSDTGSATVVSEEDDNFLDGNCVNSANGTYDCDFASSYWSAAPHCWAQANNGRVATMTISASSITVKFFTTSGVLSDTDFILFCKGEKL